MAQTKRYIRNAGVEIDCERRDLNRSRRSILDSCAKILFFLKLIDVFNIGAEGG